MDEAGSAPPGDGVRLVADDVAMITRANVNCYLVDAAEGPVLVDAGLPGSRRLLAEALTMFGHRPRDLVAVLLTHAHFDHVGLCRELQHDHGVPVYVHDADAPLLRHPYRYAHQSARLRYPLRYPAAVPGLGRMVAAGALGVRGVAEHRGILDREAATRAFAPVFSPGHTLGHCALQYRASRGGSPVDVLFSGDALVTYDPYTGKRGPRLVARAATADADLGFRSLDQLARTQAELLLPGHGAPFEQGAPRAVQEALRAGID
ncbi:MBL fold metallo-hydrolase [Leucobacter chromiiresistens]|uniref:Glyoxylase, beta-lactamase superfamily II n=1 Tax=Leucobacter chromiiresistens TaxID=1079994 RepID=A0A1H0YA07_9MICO|nr:MBL fold metallo-hydrolase [Leucobacter chromiiresistens]SDQ11893.1 Glyoxylase, beta-lactamase superfamily II [Leucobacter chromiiresistens]